MNIQELVARAAASLDDKMREADRIPVPGATPEFVYNDENNTFSLAIKTMPREMCQHPVQAPIDIMRGGEIVTVLHCRTCKAVMP